MKARVRENEVSIVRDVDSFEASGEAAVTIGRFDGVHRGHQALLAATVRSASALDYGHAVAITLWPPPEWVLRPAEPRRLLTTLDDRLELLSMASVSHIVVLPFDFELSRRTPQVFVELLADRFNMRTLVTGPNTAIGRDRTGTPEVLAEVATRAGCTHVQVPLEGRLGSISSSKARRDLESGDIESLREVLGRSHSYMGEVVRGDGRGELLGFRTANLVLPEQLILPKDGVYTASAIVDGETERQALVSVGVRPTFGPSSRLFEVHILDFDRRIYGCQVRVFLQRRLRGQKRFDSRAGLIEAMRADVDAARALGPIDVSGRMPF